MRSMPTEPISSDAESLSIVVFIILKVREDDDNRVEIFQYGFSRYIPYDTSY